MEILDGSEFGVSKENYTVGTKVSRNISSLSGVDIIFNANGSMPGMDFLGEKELGMKITFNAKNQLFLKAKNMHQITLSNINDMRDKVLQAFVEGDLPASTYLVRGIVVAEKYYLVYSGSNGGEVGIKYNDANIRNFHVNSDFSVVWKKSVGYEIDGSEGGTLAYRVSVIRARRHLRPKSIQQKILMGSSEAEALDSLSLKDRKLLQKDGVFDIVDATDELALDLDEEHT